MSVEWHTETRVATLIIVSAREWYGPVLPFHIFNSESHEPLQGDASSLWFQAKLRRRYADVINHRLHLGVNGEQRLLLLFLIKRQDRDHLCAVILRAERAAAPTPGNVDWSRGRSALTRSASSDPRQPLHGVEYSRFSEHCHRLSLVCFRSFHSRMCVRVLQRVTFFSLWEVGEHNNKVEILLASAASPADVCECVREG